MSVTFKNRVSYPEMLTAIFIQQLNFPMSLLWIVLHLYLVHASGIVELLRSGQEVWFFGALGNLLLYPTFFTSVIFVLLFGMIYLLRYSKPSLGNEEFTLSEQEIAFKTEMNETRFPLKGVRGYVECGRFLVLMRSDLVNGVAFDKRNLTPEQLQEVRVLLRGKHSFIVQFASKAFFPAYLLVLGLTAWLQLTPLYTVRSSSENVQAYWQDDTAVFSLPVYTSGEKEVLFQRMHPLLNVLLNRRPPTDTSRSSIENHIFIVRDGKMKAVTLRGGLEEVMGAIQPVGNDLLMMRYVKRRQEFSRFDGESFVPASEEERTEYLRRMKECRRDRCGWKRFDLWDEGGEEKENEEADQQYRATIPLKSSTLVLGMDVVWVDRKEYAKDVLYTLKGLDPKGVAQELLAVGGKSRRVTRAEYEKLLPYNGAATSPPPGGEASEGTPSAAAPAATLDAPPDAQGTTPVAAVEAAGNSGSGVVEAQGTTPAAAIDAVGNSTVPAREAAATPASAPKEVAP